MSIRLAHPTDYHATARLIQAALDTITSNFSGEEDREDNPARYLWLEDLFQQTGNRFSYQQILVKEVEHQVVGTILTYHGSEIEALDHPLNERLRRLRNDPTLTLEREAELDEFYIDALAVSPAFSGRGHGTELIRAAEQRARERQYAKIALLVDEHNKHAYRLYERLGYQMDKMRMLYGERFWHMVKYL